MPPTITAKGEPLHGKSSTVPDNMSSYPSLRAADKGTYRLTEKQAVWEPAAPPANAESKDGD